MYTPEQIERIRAIGNEWHKGNYHRVYFNNLSELYGIKTNRYNSGNISSATLDGEKISNSAAKRILGRLACVKIWFDLTDNEFHCKDRYGELHDGDFEKIIHEIEERINV